jgi:amino acid transporter
MGIGPLLCWAVVFADIGTSVYYTPGILFGQVGSRAPLFVAMTLVVFVLLTRKYAEVAIRYPEGGGVVTVGAHAANSFVGLVGGLLILVDYFLTSALSALSGFIYLSVVFPNLGGGTVLLTVAALVLLGALNLLGARADAKVTAIIATVAFASQVAVVIAVLTHFGVADASAPSRRWPTGRRSARSLCSPALPAPSLPSAAWRASPSWPRRCGDRSTERLRGRCCSWSSRSSRPVHC